jgi:hypothetical protein
MFLASNSAIFNFWYWRDRAYLRMVFYRTCDDQNEFELTMAQPNFCFICISPQQNTCFFGNLTKDFISLYHTNLAVSFGFWATFFQTFHLDYVCDIYSINKTKSGFC